MGWCLLRSRANLSIKFGRAPSWERSRGEAPAMIILRLWASPNNVTLLIARSCLCYVDEAASISEHEAGTMSVWGRARVFGADVEPGAGGEGGEGEAGGGVGSEGD